MAAGISVVIPVKDGARYLRGAADAVGAQRIDAPVEMLVVDSGSATAPWRSRGRPARR